MTLIGATTENPYFEVNSALLSRCAGLRARAARARTLVDGRRSAARRRSRRELADELARLDRASAPAATRATRSTSSSSRAQTARGGGRAARRARTSRTPRASGRSSTTRAATRTTTSSRRSSSRCAARDPDAAVYYLAAMLEGGEDRALHRAADDRPRLRGRRQRRPAGAARRGRGGARASSTSACPEARLNLAQAAIYLARAPKSNAVATARSARRRADVREHGDLRPPDALRDAHYPGAKKLGHGAGLRLPARRPGGLRGRLPPGRAEGPDVLRAVRANGEEAPEPGSRAPPSG